MYETHPELRERELLPPCMKKKRERWSQCACVCVYVVLVLSHTPTTTATRTTTSPGTHKRKKKGTMEEKWKITRHKLHLFLASLRPTKTAIYICPCPTDASRQLAAKATFSTCKKAGGRKGSRQLPLFFLPLTQSKFGPLRYWFLF